MTSRQTRASFAITAGVFAVLLDFACTYMAHRELGEPGFWLTATIGMTGVSVGWLLGLVASPQSDREEARFHSFAKLVAAAVSGYLLSQLQPVLSAVLDPKSFLASPVHSLRLLSFVALVIISAITMFVFRSYMAERVSEGAPTDIPPSPK